MVRQANEIEREKILAGAPNSLVLIWDEGHGIEGHLCLSPSDAGWFGHDLQVTTKNAHAAPSLWLHARDWLRRQGEDTVYIHFDGEDPGLREHYARNGFVKVMEIWKGSL